MDRCLFELNESNHELAVMEAGSVGSLLKQGRGYAVVREPDVRRRLGASHRVSRYLGESEATVGAAVEKARGLDVSFDGTFSVRARVHDGDVSATELQRRVGGVFADSAPVDLDSPDDTVRLIVSEGKVLFGLHLCETSGFEGRAPTEKPFFKPGSMSCSLARALSNIAGGYGGTKLLDPTCGTGGVLIESALAGGRAIGCDASREMVKGARKNLCEYTGGGRRLFVADGRGLPLSEGAVGCAVTDLPYGRASHVEGQSPEELAYGVLEELRRVVRDNGRVVAVSDGWLDEKGKDAGFEVLGRIEDRVHRSLTRRIVVFKAS